MRLNQAGAARSASSASAADPIAPGAGVFGPDPARRRFARLVCLVVGFIGWTNVAVLGRAMLSKNPPEAGFDLQLLLDAAKRIAAGGSPYDAHAVSGGLQASDLFYSYPPVVAQALVPFSGLPTWLVLTGWCVGAAIGLVVVAALLARSPLGRPASALAGLPVDVALLTLAAAPYFFPFVVAVLFGNVDAWFPLLFGAVALTLASGRGVSSRVTGVAGGVALAIASVVKLHPATLVVWLAARRPANSAARRTRVRVIGAAIATGLAILAVSLVVGGAGPWTDYPHYLSLGSNADLASRVNIGPASQLALLAGDGSLARPLAFIVAVLAVGLTFATSRLVRDDLESFAWAVVASLIVLPVTWYHYPAALVPVALAAWTRSRGTPARRRVSTLLVAAIVVSDAAIVLPVALWLAVALLFMAIRSSRRAPSVEALLDAEVSPESVPAQAIAPAEASA